MRRRISFREKEAALTTTVQRNTPRRLKQKGSRNVATQRSHSPTIRPQFCLFTERDTEQNHFGHFTSSSGDAKPDRSTARQKRHLDTVDRVVTPPPGL